MNDSTLNAAATRDTPLIPALRVAGLCICLAALMGCMIARPKDLAQVNPIAPEVPASKDLPTVECWVSLAAQQQCAEQNLPAECPPKQDAAYCRNFIQDQLMILSNRVCDEHLAAIHANAAVMNAFLGFTNLVLAGIAAVTPGAAASSWAAGAALAGGTRELLNSEIYQGKIVSAIITEIHANRKAARDTIETHRDADATEYSPSAAVREAMEYHDECSFYAGLTSLVDKAGETEKYSGEWAAASTDDVQAQIDRDKTDLEEVIDDIAEYSTDPSLQAQAQASNERANELRQRIARNETLLEYMNTLVTASSYRGKKIDP